MYSIKAASGQFVGTAMKTKSPMLIYLQSGRLEVLWLFLCSCNFYALVMLSEWMRTGRPKSSTWYWETEYQQAMVEVLKTSPRVILELSTCLTQHSRQCPWIDSSREADVSKSTKRIDQLQEAKARIKSSSAIPATSHLHILSTYMQIIDRT